MSGGGPKVVVVAHPRSGSNSLVQILESHPDLALLDEPFNEDRTSWAETNLDYLSKVTDLTSLDEVIDGILIGYSGFKVHSYQLEPGLLAHLLHRRDLHVISLRRQNLLEAAVSGLVAEQTGLWAEWDRDRPLEEYYADLSAISVEDVREKLRCVSENVAEVAAILRDRGDGRVLELCYEDLFLSDLGTRRRLVDSVWSHLGVPRCDNSRVRHFLENPAFRLGTPATYGRLPDLAEIESVLGNDESGHIGYLAPIEGYG